MAGRRTAVEAADEKFWKGREEYLRATTGQPCCTLAGMSSQLAAMEGDFAVVIHGERDCINGSFAFSDVSGQNFYCTGLSQQDVMAGRSRRALDACLDAVLDTSPKVVFVLGTCMTEMTGEDYEPACAAAQKRHGIPVVALRTSGLRCGSQSEMLDWLFASLASLSGSRRPRGRGFLNLIGFPAWENTSEPFIEELPRVLGAAGVRLNGCYPGSSGLSDWERALSADTAAVLDVSVYPRLTARLRASGMTVLEVPQPVGLGPAIAFYESVAARFRSGPAMKRALEKESAAGRSAIAEFRRRHSGRRLAYAIRMSTNYRSDLVAYDGLGDLPFLLELGFEPVILVQGPTEKKAKDAFVNRIRALGFEQPVEVFPDPFLLGTILREGRFDLAYLAGHARKEAAEAGVPLLQYHSFQPFLSSIAHNVELVESLLERAPLAGSD